MELDLDNHSFSLAWSFINSTDQNVFLTGNAGTGKTTFLHQLRKLCPKKMAIVAPTGVAAINAGGVTIHSFFQLPFGSFIPDEHPQWNDPNARTYNKQSLFRNLKLRKKQRDLINNLELLIIDEVSMVRADLLDAIDQTLKGVRRNIHQPFGGVQVLFIGDLFQLPPVVREEEWNILSDYYHSPFFFDAQIIHEHAPVPITLTKIYRQKNDQTFINILNRIRFNEIEVNDLEHLNAHVINYLPDTSDRPITLTTHNRQADKINNAELDKLPGPKVALEANIVDLFPEHAYPADVKLELKVGAQVMFIKNDKGEDRKYYNGKIGTITKINRIKQIIEISSGGDIIELVPEQWDNIRYEYDEKKDEIQELKIGSFEQFPLRLAWAVTVHKSQGLTFDEAMIDLGQAFAPGQVYVALSRLTNLEGLKLLQPIQRRHIKTDERVLAFSQNQPEEAKINEFLQLKQIDYVKNLICDLFDMEELCEAIRNHAASYQKYLIPNNKSAFDWGQSLLPTVYDIISASDKYLAFLKYHLFSDNPPWEALRARNANGVPYFKGLLDHQLKAAIVLQMEQYKGIRNSALYLKDLNLLKSSIEDKLTALDYSNHLLKSLQHPNNINEVLTAYFKLKNKQLKEKDPSSNLQETDQKNSTTPTKITSEQQSLKAFQDGKSIEEIAKERNIQVNTVHRHLVNSYPAFRLHIDDLVAPNIRKQIISLLHERDDWKNKELYEAMEGIASYNDIAAARKYYQTIMEQRTSIKPIINQ